MRGISNRTWWTHVLCESALIYLISYSGSKTMTLLRLDPYTGQVTTYAPPFYLQDNPKILLSAHEWDGKFSISSIEQEEIHTWVLDDDEFNEWRSAVMTAPRKEEMGCNRVHSVCFV